MSAILKIADYSGHSGGVTEMPFSNGLSASYFSSNGDEVGRTGAEMLTQPDQRPDLNGSVTYPMWNFRILGVPLSVKVALDDETWIASIEAFDVFGDGQSPRDALAVLEDHLLNYIDFYRDQRAADLTDFAKNRRAQFLKIKVMS